MVSVIVPVYNAGDTLHAAIQSVSSQSYKDWELILVDDGSTDGSGAVCDSAAAHDTRIRTVHRPNGGLSAARNTGLDAAKGGWISFLDADDALHPDFLSLMVGTAASSGADIVCAPHLDFATPHTLTAWMSRPVPDNSPFEAIEPSEALGHILYRSHPWLDNSAWGKLYDARLWRTTRFTEGIGYEDLDIVDKVFFDSSKVAAIGPKLYGYRTNPTSYLHTFSLRRADVLDVTARLSERMRVSHPELLPAALDRELSANFNILALLAASGLHSDEARAIEKKCWDKIKSLRRASLFNRRVRLKNKLGIAASYAGGLHLLRLLAKLESRK